MKKRSKAKVRSKARKPSRASRKSVKRASRKSVKRTAKKASRKSVKRTARKPSRKAAKKASRKSTRSARSRPVKSTGTLMVEPMEQVTVACSSCGREFNIVKLPGLSTEGMICQRCEVGEIQFPE